MLSFKLPKLPSWAYITGSSVDLPPAEVHDVEENRDKRARALKHLLKANHINHSVIYNNLRFHNHAPHILSSAYILGATPDQLNDIYEAESKDLEAWKDSPGEIAKHDWRDFLGKREYQRAFLDFFEDQLVQHGYDWRALLDEFLLEGDEPLINNLISGLAHPLIHLGYGYEISSRTVAIEALTLAACFYNDWHVYLDDPQYTKPAPNSTDSLFTIIDRVAHDKTLDGLFDGRGIDNIDVLLKNEKVMATVLEHWNSWDIQTPREQFAESQKLATALLVAAQMPRNDTRHDFFAVHLLTSSHAIRVLLPLLPYRWHTTLIRQWWLFTLLVYIAQLRPRINIDQIKLVELDGRDWKNFVIDKAVNGDHRTEAHFVKALRSMHEASKTWGDHNQFFLKAAVKFCEEFGGWGGFDSASVDYQ